MHYLTQVQRGIDYIETHLEDELSPVAIAKAAGLSQWHFQRIFKGLTNETLKAYIRSRRLANALVKLEDPNHRIIDIALGAGFESQATFTRAFKSAFDLTPHQYRSFQNKRQLVKKVQFDAEYIQHIHQNLSLAPTLYEQRPMQLVGLRTKFHSIDSEKNNIGVVLPALWGDFLARLGEVEQAVEGVCYGVVQTTPDTDLLEYCAAIEVDGDVLGDIPDGMVHMALPSSLYARFSHRERAEELDKTVDFIYASWLMTSGRKHTYGADLEIYGPEYDPTSPDSVIHYAIPIHPMSS